MSSTARAARADVESVLAANGWPWSLVISRGIYALVTLEEQQR